jgi:hypothetical protein
MLTTLRFLFLLMLGLLGFQPFSYAYDADGFVSSAEQCTYVPTTHSHVSSAETVASVPLCLDRDRAASASQANMRPTENSIAAEELPLQSQVLQQQMAGDASALRFTPDQQALVDLAKQAQNVGGVTPEQAQILQEWADEVGLDFRGPEVHPGRPFGQYPHIHVGPINHIPVTGVTP